MLSILLKQILLEQIARLISRFAYHFNTNLTVKMTKKRKFYPTKKLGEKDRRDVKIKDKKEFIKRIIKYKEKKTSVPITRRI